ncbi:MAG: hypothetical protein WAT81_05035 [Candidatus Moraniibacteriota bacterium]
MSLSLTSKSITRIFSFLIIVLILWQLWPLSSFYLYNGAFGEFFNVIVTGIILFFFTLHLSFFLSKRLSREKTFFILLFLVSSVIFIMGALFVYGSRNHVLYLEISFRPTISLLFAAFSIATMRLLSASDVPIQTFNFLKIISVGLLLFLLTFFSASLKRIPDHFRAKGLEESVQFSDVRDDLLYTQNGNPIGVILSYSITPLMRDFHDNQNFNNAFGLELNFDPAKYRSLVTGLNILKAESRPLLGKEEFLKKDQSYKITTYSIPDYLGVVGTTSVSPLVDDSLAARINNNTMTSLDGLCIYQSAIDSISRETDLVGHYSTSVAAWRVETIREYNAKSFFETLQKEGVRVCPI